MNEYKHHCGVENAAKFYDWILNRGGVAVWNSVDLSCAKTWSTPYLDPAGEAPMPKQSWQMANTPDLVVTSLHDVEVFEDKEVKRFRIAIRRSGNGLNLKVTDAMTRKIRRAVERAGEGAHFGFDYDTQEAVIYAPVESYSLAEWAEKNQPQTTTSEQTK